MDFLRVLFYTLTIYKMETFKIAVEALKGHIDWNKYQHMTNQTEAEALEKWRAFTEAAENERDQNVDFYNEHKEELAKKFHHLLAF